MTDPTAEALHAERIERLTELARRVWPHLLLEVLGRGALWRVHVASWDHDMLAVDGTHPRALDALEAALLVLDGQLLAQPWQAEMFRDLTEHLGRLRAEPPPWVEQLASEWEQRGHELGQWSTERVLMEQLAAELRERAKAKP